MRQGKDTAVRAIIEARGDKFDIKRYGFADAVKQEVAGREFNLCIEHGIPYEPDNRHRSLLQWYGTEFRRKQDLHYWVKQLHRKLCIEKPQIALIPDLRFLNEMYYVKQAGGLTIRLTRQGYVSLGPAAQHQSETELDGVEFDYDLTVGDDNVDDLKEGAVRVFDMIVDELDFSNAAKQIVETEGVTA